jgi:hypothetical protein
MANGGAVPASRKVSGAVWMIALLRAGMAGGLALEQYGRSSINMLFGGISHRLDAKRHLEISKVALALLHYTRSYVHMS